MLVLSRKHGERIHIGDDIFIEVRRVAGSRVTLAVSAPKQLRVLRGELLEAAKSFEQPETPEVEPTATGSKSESFIVTPEHVSHEDPYQGSHAIG